MPSESFVYRAPPKSRRQIIGRLRTRLNEAQSIEQLRSVLQGLLDMLSDEQ